MRSTVLGVIGALVATACSAPFVDPSAYDSESATVTISVVDETGAGIPGATFSDAASAVGSVIADEGGLVTLSLDQPVAGLIEADGFLPEPIVLDPSLPAVTLRLWARAGPQGAGRFAMHFAGDTMLGRRYLEPGRAGTARVTTGDGGESARAVVSDVSAIFAAADLSMLNLETVIDDGSGGPAGKRFILTSPDEAVAALTALGVDVATLGNNHSADRGDAGVAATVAALAAAGITPVGAGADDIAARGPALNRVGDVTVATLSYTTVTGSAVNDALPVTGDPVPADLPPESAWQYRTAAFSWDGLETGRYRAGDVWRWFSTLALDDDAESELWQAMTTTYPELQDWVARRGHGGAAWFRPAAVTEDVAAARASGADLVVVQLHGGFQFSSVASRFFVDSAHAAVEAGADLVVGHHPHVLQGFERHQGVLITHSLGNFAFDQDFLSTFASAVLRVVFEGERMLEARVLPVVIDRYRPVFAAGELATGILDGVRADSTGGALTDRIDGRVARVVGSAPTGGLDLVRDGNAGVIGEVAKAEELSVAIDARGVGMLPPGTLVWTRGLDAGVALGRDVFGWGGFDDVTADGRVAGGVQWALDSALRSRIISDDGEPALHLHGARSEAALIRPVGRVALSWAPFMFATGEVLDLDVRYTLRARIRRRGPATPVLRLDLYHFDDSDPLDDPESRLLGRTEVPLDVAPGEEWAQTETVIPSPRPVEGVMPNAVMVYLMVESGTPTEVLVDDLALVEWYSGSALPTDLWLQADLIRSTDDEVSLTVR